VNLLMFLTYVLLLQHKVAHLLLNYGRPNTLWGDSADYMYNMLAELT